ncbi:DNA-binding transcriptional MerR regulator [Herbihabitans rhizosphaerae]|uniref:DNA-binding transcriptional MerR regulator n=1 Tax=Herbihabitans rhizosphaerae TaxID=1872711 RepID=A0A4Q7KFP0_9PSEU|nr:MerR family transcriptional regulator [Herbihabitans rhizosphaerae]RZS34043.1 DNA-binding transcriptional MerR regulator [Herbihabitans rhizosphaerae]
MTTWKVGELAAMTGLTVRTLHHYDEIGLLRPLGRTAAGHRLYGQADVRRLYAVITLRDLGIPLDQIAGMLDGEPDIAGMLRDHLSRVDSQLQALRTLRRRLAVLTAHADRTPEAAELLDLLDHSRKAQQTFERYFTEEQISALDGSTISEWPRLIAAVQSEMDSGTDPAHPRVRRLAREWMRLLERFHGDDPNVRDSLYRMRADNSDEIADHGGPTDEMIDYIKRANAPRVPPPAR